MMKARKTWFVIIVSAACVAFYSLFLNSRENDGEIIHYVLGIDETYQFFNVKITIENSGSEPLIFRMPRWSPGAYRLRDYADNVVTFEAFNRNHKNLNVQKISADGWQVVPDGGYLAVEYQVEPAFETWSQGALDSSYALAEGPSVFMYVDGKTHLPATVEYRVPQNWQAASPLKPIGDGRFYADNYDTLIDAPAQLGNFARYQFAVNNTPIELVFDGNSDFSVDSFLVMTKKICEYQIDFFNEIPFERYVFFYKLLPGRSSGGGLEHANSTTIGLSAERLSTNVLSAAEVTAHEFFHVWNVERIRPKVFESIDYSAVERTNALWFSEGVTSYYEALTLLRTNLWSEERFLTEMERQIEQLLETGDRRETSVEEASHLIWERGYIHRGVSFYNKGALLGLLLDLNMRHVTRNRVSLDDLMRFMNWWFAKENVGFEDDDIRRAVNALTQNDFSRFFDNYVAGTRELPFEEALSFAGFSTTITTNWVASIGDVIFVGPRNRIVYIEEDSPISQSDVRKGDYLMQVDGIAIVSFSQFEEIVRRLEMGSQVTVTVSREDQQMQFSVVVGKKELADCEIELMNDTLELQQIIRRGWLEGWTGPAQSNSN